jgi:HEAT repeat protein
MYTPSPLPRTLEAAVRDVTHKKPEVRMSAVRDLGRIAGGDERKAALAALVRALEHDETAAVRSEAAIALADAQAHECLGALVAALDDGHTRVRQMAMLALGETARPSDKKARGIIERALGDGSAEVRFQALIAMHRIAGDDAEQAVLAKTHDDDAHIRHVALRLAEERHLEAGGELPEPLRLRARGALRDDAPSVRLAAAVLLARAGDEAGKQVIADAVNSGKGVDPEDEQAAIQLAGELRIEAARGGLMQRAWSMLPTRRPRYKWQARIALAALGDTRARQSILRGLDSWSRDARTLAVAAAGRAGLSEARPLLEAMSRDAARADPEAVREALEQLGERE